MRALLQHVRGRAVNAYSTDFLHDLEALSLTLSDVLARIDDSGASGLTAAENNYDTIKELVGDRRSENRAAARPPLPDPRLVRQIIRQRQLRARYLPGELFADPAWDMLLDLTAATAERTRISVTSLCLASGVPPTTALRWISLMEEAGLVHRECDETDRRRAFIVLNESSIASIARYFQAIRRAPHGPV